MYKNIFTKKKWQEELDTVAEKYASNIRKLTETRKDVEVKDLKDEQKYRSGSFSFYGKEIISAVQDKLSRDVNYTYEMRMVSDYPVWSRSYIVYKDDALKDRETGIIFTDHEGNVTQIKNDNIVVTIEDLKARYVESRREIEDLKKVIKQKDLENKNIFIDSVELAGGFYEYVTKKKYVLMLSKLMKDMELYNTDKGVKYSIEALDEEDYNDLLDAFYKRKNWSDTQQ